MGSRVDLLKDRHGKGRKNHFQLLFLDNKTDPENNNKKLVALNPGQPGLSSCYHILIYLRPAS